jgi:predicted small lipoprotein YifL
MTAATRIALLLGFLVLAACGKKGPLYLPDRGGEVITRPAATPPEEPDETGKKKQQGGTPPQSPQ